VAFRKRRCGITRSVLPTPAELRQRLLEVDGARNRLGMIDKLSQARAAS